MHHPIDFRAPLPAGAATLLADLADHLAAVAGMAAKTVDNRVAAARAFLRWHGQGAADVTAATTRDIHGFLVALAEHGAKPATRTWYLAGVKALFAYLVHRGQLDCSPASGVRGPRSAPPRIEVYSPEQASQILRFTAGLAGLGGAQTHTMLATLRYTGIRSSELAGQPLDGVDLEARRLHVTGKGGRHRLVPVAPPLAQLLSRFVTTTRPRLPDNGLLFANPQPQSVVRRHAFSDEAIRYRVQLAGAGAGVPGRHFPHRWRHSFATEMIRAGVNLHTVQRILGHRRIEDTLAYTHLDDGDLRRAVDRVF